MHAVLTKNPLDPVNVMMWAACCLGYFAFLRSGEFTISPGSNFDPVKHLSPADIAVDSHTNPTMLRVHLKYSKTDQCGEGIDLWVGRSYNNLCPVSVMLTYLVQRGNSVSPLPLFMFPDGKPLSREALVHGLKKIMVTAGMDPTKFSGHSFRISAASTAAARGIHESTIQTLGRWNSDCYKRYVRIPRQKLATISKSISV